MRNIMKTIKTRCSKIKIKNKTKCDILVFIVYVCVYVV